MFNSVKESTCKYLFNKEANEVFGKLQLPPMIDKKQFIDQCLELCMRINSHILTHQEGFFLLHPMAFNAQCHLYALRVAQLKAVYPHQTEEEKMARNEENRFLHLSFFLSYSLMSDTKLFLQVINSVRTTHLKEQAPGNLKQFKIFLLDSQNERIEAARLAFNQLFECDLKNRLSQLKEQPLYSELFQMANENLRVQSTQGRRGEVLYTYPKLAGLVYLVDTITSKQIPCVIKVKVITQEGAAGTIIGMNSQAHGKTPVLVFETIATDGSYSISDCREHAKKCPTYFFRYTNKKQRHLEEESCFFCKKTTIDLEPFRQRLQLAMSAEKEMFYALGTDFILNNQTDFKPFFENSQKYPLLTKIFQEALPKIKELELDTKRPETFSVCTVHMDNASEAFSSSHLLDKSPETLLKERGIIP